MGAEAVCDGTSTLQALTAAKGQRAAKAKGQHVTTTLRALEVVGTAATEIRKEQHEENDRADKGKQENENKDQVRVLREKREEFKKKQCPRCGFM